MGGKRKKQTNSNLKKNVEDIENTTTTSEVVEKRRKQTNSNLKKNVEDIENTTTASEVRYFSEIVGIKWKVFRVSPLYNFTQTKLKRYGHKLSAELNATRKLHSQIIYKCTFSISDKLRPNEECAEAIKIEVTDDQSKDVYCAYFISWADEKEILNNCISLPILLVNARGSELEVINSAIGKMFDCVIQPVLFPFFALIKFFVIQLQSPQIKEDVSEKLIFLEYKIPGCKASDRLKVSLFLQETTIILALLIDNMREKFKGVKNADIIMEFYNRITTHIYNVYEMELMHAELYKVAFPEAFVTADGYLKISSNEVAPTILHELQICTSIEKIINFHN